MAPEKQMGTPSQKSPETERISSQEAREKLMSSTKDDLSNLSASVTPYEPEQSFERNFLEIREDVIKNIRTPGRITQLNPESAKLLIEKFKGDILDLRGLITLDTETAREVAKFKRLGLYLRGLTTIDTATAREFAKFEGKYLHLNGLINIDPETARELATFKGIILNLSGLKTLDPETAKELAKFKNGDLRLDGLTTLDLNTVTELVKFEKVLGLTGLENIDKKTLAKLKQLKERVYLPYDLE